MPRPHGTGTPAAPQRAEARVADGTWLIGLGVCLVVVLAFTAMVALTQLAGGETFPG